MTYMNLTNAELAELATANNDAGAKAEIQRRLDKRIARGVKAKPALIRACKQAGIEVPEVAVPQPKKSKAQTTQVPAKTSEPQSLEALVANYEHMSLKKLQSTRTRTKHPIKLEALDFLIARRRQDVDVVPTVDKTVQSIASALVGLTNGQKAALRDLL